jgi:type IV pilus assembly protein PilE
MRRFAEIRAMHRTNKGVTLIELLIVVIVISILSSIAVPGYRQYLIRANRTEAKATLLATAAALERCFTRFNAYDNANCAAATQLAGAGIPTDSGGYLVTGVINPVNYSLTATTQGTQAKDTGCGNLTLDQTNTKGRSGTKPVTECWGR